MPALGSIIVSAGPSSAVPLSARRVPALDGLRGLAILLVFLYHLALFSGWQATAPLDRALSGLMLHGWIGVDLFFVLSGFLITGILLDSRGEPGWLRRFYLRRIFRIVPAYYAALVVQLVVLAIAGEPGRARIGWTATWLTNHLLSREGWDALVTTLHHFWSLAVEEQYYILWPLLVGLIAVRRLRWLALLLIVAACVSRVVLVQRGALVGSYVLLPARMDGLAVGGLLAMMVRGGTGAAGTARSLRLPALFAALLLVLLAAWRGRLAYGDPFMLALGLSALALVAGAVMLYAMGRDLAGRGPRWLESGPLPLLGKYSYALYLWHQPVILWLAGAGIGAALLPPILGSRLPGVLLAGLIAGAVSLALARLSWRLLEQPANRLKERLTARPAP